MGPHLTGGVTTLVDLEAVADPNHYDMLLQVFNTLADTWSQAMLWMISCTDRSRIVLLSLRVTPWTLCAFKTWVREHAIIS